jgi:hypothetical protein
MRGKNWIYVDFVSALIVQYTSNMVCLYVMCVCVTVCVSVYVSMSVCDSM